MESKESITNYPSLLYQSNSLKPNKLSGLSKKTHTQPIRATSSYQFDHNPFSKTLRKARSMFWTSLEFLNYKSNEKFNQDVESIRIDDSPKSKASNESKITSIKVMSDITSMSIKELEKEINYELMFGTLLSNDVEKDIDALIHLQKITEDEVLSLAVELPPSKHINTIVLDLDETLIHSRCHFNKEKIVGAMQLTYFSETAKAFISFEMKKRPFLEAFLRTIREYFELFTASEKEYANKILSVIDPNNVICHRLYRESCVVRGDYKIKDLRILNRDLKHVVIVDNSLVSFMSQINNGIPIKSYLGEDDDMSLMELISYCKELSNSSDVTLKLRDLFCLEKIVSDHASRSPKF